MQKVGRTVTLPVVGVIADRRQQDGVSLECVRRRYLDALRRTAGVTALIIPSGLCEDEVAACLQALDGLLLTGAQSNVDPGLYHGPDAPLETLDPDRDQTSIAAIRYAISIGLPILGICRGLQELNVALGGSLTHDISDGEGRLAHVEDCSQPRDLQYSPAHTILAEGSGEIASCIRMVSSDGSIKVNSLHGQGIERLADGLAVDARSSDGVVEAVSMTAASNFTAGVQWHPEWFHADDPLSGGIFRRFGQACRDYKTTEILQ